MLIRNLTLVVAAISVVGMAGCKSDKAAKPAEKKTEAKAEAAKPAPAPEAPKPAEAAPAPEAAKPAEPAAKPVEIAKRPDIEIKKLPSMSPEEMEARRNKIRDIYKLGDEPTEENAAKLKAMISDDTLPPHERSAAVRAISRTKRDDMIEVLKGFADAKELNVAAEAVITLYRWGEKEFALPKLEALQKKGVPLRRAFFLGRQDGNYVYDDNAKDFFTKGIEAIQPHVKLDAALGLLHLGQMDVALPLFKAAMQPSEKNYVRLTALNYLAGASYLPEVDQILFAALSDPDPKVAARARQIVGPRTEPRQAVPQDPAAAKAKADELPQPSTEPESGAPAEAAPAPVVEVAPAAAPAAAPAPAPVVEVAPAAAAPDAAPAAK